MLFPQLQECLKEVPAEWSLCKLTLQKEVFLKLILKRKCVIYVPDTGIYKNHIEFKNSDLTVIYSYNGDDGSDINGHGTAVCSLICGATLGVIDNAKVMVLKVTDTRSYQPKNLHHALEVIQQSMLCLDDYDSSI